LRRLSAVRVFSREELSRYNGRNGAPAYVAYDGKVYDVTESFHWKGGRHHVLHDAGQDLTESMGRAPHPAELLKKFPVVGILRD
jgi:predicted heme/steroid binding protein